MYKIEGKVALVTGSTAGLGRQLASVLLKEGAQVIINGRSMERLRETRTEFEASGSKIAALRGDVSSPEDCGRMVQECIRKFGRLDILINNAGTGSIGLFSETLPHAMRKVIETNLFGTIYPTYYSLPHIIESGGRIIFISSLAGIHGLPHCYSYSTSKMALTALAQSLTLELSGTGAQTGIMYLGFLKNRPEKRHIGGDGLPVPTTSIPQRFTMTMEEASTRIIHAIRMGKRSEVFSGLGKWLYFMNRLSPWLVQKILETTMERMNYAYTPVTEAG